MLFVYFLTGLDARINTLELVVSGHSTEIGNLEENDLLLEGRVAVLEQVVHSK